MEKDNKINNNEKNQKDTRKSLFVILLIILFCLVITLVVIMFGFGRKENSNKIDEFSNNVDEEVFEQNIAQALYHDYNKGVLTADEYVKNMLYAKYDSARLPDKYKSKKSAYLIEIDNFIDENLEELSDDTLKYYIGKANLENITFELNKENASVKNNILDSLTNTVYADSEQVTNLNKAILSKNGNFVVWYTTTGDNKIDEKEAKKIADGLEETAGIYDDKFKTKYTFKSNFLSKGKKYENQVEVLKSQNIKEEYLENAMQVYLVNYTSDCLAEYMQGYGILLKLWNRLCGDDHMGSVVFPYMLIKPSSFDDMERLEQIYNHELFHHYQHNVLASDDNITDDPYIFEATANFASSIVTEKTTNEGYLNEWAGTARIFSNNLLSDEWAEKHSIGNVGYALFVYLNLRLTSK